MTEREFAKEVMAKYRRQGWRSVDPRKIERPLDFEPDMILKKGDTYLVVEVKQPGTSIDHSIGEMRRAVEKRPNWRFELKLAPPTVSGGRRTVAAADMQKRVELATNLAKQGFEAEAALIAWIVIETGLRKLLSKIGDAKSETQISKLIRRAYEEGKIKATELQGIQRALAYRNHIVHGFKADAGSTELEPILSLARNLSERNPAGARKLASKVTRNAAPGRTANR